MWVSAYDNYNKSLSFSIYRNPSEFSANKPSSTFHGKQIKDGYFDSAEELFS